jgi:hypothetical protein
MAFGAQFGRAQVQRVEGRQLDPEHTIRDQAR